MSAPLRTAADALGGAMAASGHGRGHGHGDDQGDGPAAAKKRPSVDRERASKLLHFKQRWTQFQAERALKSTSQRELIVEEFLRCEAHVSVEELHAAVRRRNPKVGYATVYRTLKLLAEAGLAAARQFGDGQTRYELEGPDAPHHDHLICTHCGLILEFENDEIEKLQDTVAERLGGFKIVQHKLELYGLCPKAQGYADGLCPDEQRGGERKAKKRAPRPRI